MKTYDKVASRILGNTEYTTVQDYHDKYHLFVWLDAIIIIY